VYVEYILLLLKRRLVNPAFSFASLIVRQDA
jgi:hypothetical protein